MRKLFVLLVAFMFMGGCASFHLPIDDCVYQCGWCGGDTNSGIEAAAPETAPEPEPEPGPAPEPGPDCNGKPGWGYGDPNHDHTGPPGHGHGHGHGHGGGTH